MFLYVLSMVIGMYLFTTETHCPGDRVYTTCGSACPQTCDNKDELIVCPAICLGKYPRLRMTRNVIHACMLHLTKLKPLLYHVYVHVYIYNVYYTHL